MRNEQTQFTRQNKIKQLDTLTNDEKAYLVNLVNTKKKYGLVWENKTEDVEEQLRTQLPVLKEVPHRRILAADQPQPQKHSETKQATLFDNNDNNDNNENPDNPSSPPNHILIEGDNLHALTALTFTHEGAIDVIYIDPPYNTGKKDEYRYNDDWVVKEDSFRHSRWISFINKRLRIAKKLLNDNGVIFISIDDNEQAQLKLICDEVFGEDNQVAHIIIQSNKRGQTYKDVAKTHEYLLCYTKRPETSLSEIEKTDDDLNFSDDVSPFSIRELRNRNPKFGKFNRPNLFFPIYVSKNNFDSNNFHLISLNQSNEFSIEVFPFNSEGKESCWRWSTSLLDKMNTKRLSTTPVIAKQKKDGGWNIYEKYRKTTERVKSIWDEKEVISEKGSVELKELGMSSLFAFPKPVGLIKKALSISTNESSIILDFFAGSGTTPHATMQLNAEDGGIRQCILVTNNENKIAEEVCYERNKRVIQGYTNSKGVEVPGLINNNLRYYQTKLLGREPSLKNKRERTLLTTELLCIKEDCYTEATLELGDFTWHKLFRNGRGSFVYVVYDDFYVEEAVELLKTFIANQSPNIKLKVYVFANGQYAYAEEFEEIAENITLAALPDAIYKAYQNVLPKENKEFIPELEDETQVEPQTDFAK